MSPEEYITFETAVHSNDGHNEVRCGDFLHHAVDLLILGTPIDEPVCYREDRNPYGSSDFIVVGSLLSDDGVKVKRAVIWEIKAPQCYILDRDDSKTRFRPSKDLLKAES